MVIMSRSKSYLISIWRNKTIFAEGQTHYHILKEKTLQMNTLCKRLPNIWASSDCEKCCNYKRGYEM